MKFIQLFGKAIPIGLTFTLLMAHTSCEQQDSPSPMIKMDTTTYYGPETAFGQGTTRAWVQMTNNHQPIAVGFNMSAKAAASLPHQDMVFNLELPQEAKSTIYKSIMLNWGPGGHPPAVYQTPHFDMHFYMIDEEERNAILYEADHAHSDDFQQNCMPGTYTSTKECVPGMGVHWVDATSPELTGSGEFTKTFIIGAYKDQVIFHEPMITLAYLQSLSPNSVVPTSISQPLQVQVSGFHPRQYTVEYDASLDEYVISLTGLNYKEIINPDEDRDSVRDEIKKKQG